MEEGKTVRDNDLGRRDELWIIERQNVRFMEKYI